MVKTMNLVRILSILFFLIVFSFVYAFMPIQVKLFPESNWMIHKEQFFYYGFGLFFIINAVTWLLQKLSMGQLEETRGEVPAAWLGGLPFVLNISYTMLAGFLGVLNNPAHISPANYAYLNYLVPILIVGWIGGFIYLMLGKKGTT